MSKMKNLSQIIHSLITDLQEIGLISIIDEVDSNLIHEGENKIIIQKLPDSVLVQRKGTIIVPTSKNTNQWHI